MRLPRMATRRLMILIAVVAVLLTVMPYLCRDGGQLPGLPRGPSRRSSWHPTPVACRAQDGRNG
jgi:hypothetical protein